MSNPAPGFIERPDHKISIKPVGGSVSVQIDGHTLGSTDQAKLLTEANYSPVYYLPKEAIPPGMLEPSEHTTYCPFKGTAHYFDLKTKNSSFSNAVWYYPEPYDEALPIKNLIAFYPNIVQVG